jgi:hypothetical protein
MTFRQPASLCGCFILLLLATTGRGEITTLVEHLDNNHAARQFKFDKVPPPSRNDAAADAKFTVLYGALRKGENAHDVDRLHDGKVPDWEDQPLANFAFASGDGGRIRVDLGRAIDIEQVNSYSWHPATRAAQVYKLYGADGSGPSFDPKPGAGTDPLTCGWTLIATVDTRPKEGEQGGQYGVSISDRNGIIGHDRYLLFDISATESDDGWGNTFYGEIDVVERNAKPLPVAAYASVPSPHDPPGDPMDWQPPANPPAIQLRYGEEIYSKLAKAAREKIDVDALRAPGRPMNGLLVQSVVPGSQAIRLGIGVGDILMSLDGTPIGQRGEGQELSDMRTGQPQQLTLWSLHSGEKTITVEPGMIGVNTYDGPRLNESYARAAQRDPKWDDDMFVATSTFLTDPLLAETALARAVAAGYRGMLFNGLAARIAFGERRFVDTLNFGWPNWSANQRLNTDTLKLYYDAAILGFKPEQALDLSARYPDHLPKDNTVAEMVAAYRAMPKSNLANPIAELDNVRRTRVHQFGVFVPSDREGGDGSDECADQLNRNAVIGLDVPSGHYTEMMLTPGFANVAFSVHFDLHNSDKTETTFAHCISFRLYDMTNAKAHWDNPRDRIKVDLLDDGPSSVAAFGLPETSLDLVRPPKATTRITGTIRMVILHNRCEVTLDDKRIFYGPVIADESKRRYAIAIFGVGVSGPVNPPIFEELADPRSGR